MDNLKIIGLSGSLRQGSYNTALLRAAQELLPAGLALEIVDISQLPFFNEDLEEPLPTAVAAFKEQVAGADGLLIASPEYNYSLPAVLKNALDWASRPYGHGCFDDRPALIMGASPSSLGTAHMQYHLRQILTVLNVHVMNRPELLVANAPAKFAADGQLTDEATRERLSAALVAFKEWITRLKK